MGTELKLDMSKSGNALKRLHLKNVKGKAEAGGRIDCDAWKCGWIGVWLWAARFIGCASLCGSTLYATPKVAEQSSPSSHAFRDISVNAASRIFAGFNDFSLLLDGFLLSGFLRRCVSGARISTENMKILLLKKSHGEYLWVVSNNWPNNVAVVF